MLAFAPTLSLMFLLASQVSATFLVPFNGQNISATQMIPSPFASLVNSTCQGQCNSVNSNFTQCNDDSGCICAQGLATSFLQCEQCMYENVIQANVQMPDAKTGSAAMITAYQTACGSSGQPVLKSLSTMHVPTSGWDGPFGLGLNLVGTIFSVGAAFFLGMSGLLLLSNM